MEAWREEVEWKQHGNGKLNLQEVGSESGRNSLDACHTSRNMIGGHSVLQGTPSSRIKRLKVKFELVEKTSDQ
jgi:hypothetical protein